MLHINKQLHLQPITSKDSTVLYTLMQTIYTHAYSHFWSDNGVWYINSQYIKAALLNDLKQPNTAYYFIVYKQQIIGNCRLLWNKKLEGRPEQKQVKLHRIYLHQNVQGKGIGKQVMQFIAQLASQKNYNLIWLDTMDAKPEAYNFYKKLGYTYHAHTHLNFTKMHKEFIKMSQVYKKLM
jgi:Acetyltransferase (GNAT) family.